MLREVPTGLRYAPRMTRILGVVAAVAACMASGSSTKPAPKPAAGSAPRIAEPPRSPERAAREYDEPEPRPTTTTTTADIFGEPDWSFYCTGTENGRASTCYRSLLACMKQRERVAGVGFASTECEGRPRAACIDVEVRLYGTISESCYGDFDSCAMGRESMMQSHDFEAPSECEARD